LVNYWIFKVKDEVGGLYGRRGWIIFEHRVTERFWSFKEHNEKGKMEVNLNLISPGDCALFYSVSKEGGNRFLGSCILESAYVQLDEEQERQLVHKEFIDYNQGVFLKEVDKWKHPLPLENLQGKVSFMRSERKAGLFFQGSIKQIENQDYRLIIREHKLIT
jgi:hypothetical protein